MKKINDRFNWAISVVDVKPDDHILEIGCGSGILASLIAAKLDTGNICAIDRSAAMINKAKSHQASGSNGKLIFTKTELLNLDPAASRYDKIIAFNLPFFWKDTTEELLLIKELLNPGARLFIFYQAPYDIPAEKVAQLIKKVHESGLKVLGSQINKALFPSAVSIVAEV